MQAPNVSDSLVFEVSGCYSIFPGARVIDLYFDSVAKVFSYEIYHG